MTPGRNQTQAALVGGESRTIPAHHKVVVKVPIW